MWVLYLIRRDKSGRRAQCGCYTLALPGAGSPRFICRLGGSRCGRDLALLLPHPLLPPGQLLSVLGSQVPLPPGSLPCLSLPLPVSGTLPDLRPPTPLVPTPPRPILSSRHIVAESAFLCSWCGSGEHVLARPGEQGVRVGLTELTPGSPPSL